MMRQRVRHAVVVPLHLDVKVDVDAGPPRGRLQVIRNYDLGATPPKNSKARIWEPVQFRRSCPGGPSSTPVAESGPCVSAGPCGSGSNRAPDACARRLAPADSETGLASSCWSPQFSGQRPRQSAGLGRRHAAAGWAEPCNRPCSIFVPPRVQVTARKWSSAKPGNTGACHLTLDGNA